MTDWFDSKKLEELNDAELESLCDGCGKCCLFKLEDVVTGQVTYSNASCKLLDVETGRCLHYANRQEHIPGCLTLIQELVRSVRWLPSTCAYRLRAEGKPLPDWHPLRTGDQGSVKAAGADVDFWLRRMHRAWLQNASKTAWEGL